MPCGIVDMHNCSEISCLVMRCHVV